jgi:hypothetical protein
MSAAGRRAISNAPGAQGFFSYLTGANDGWQVT